MEEVNINDCILPSSYKNKTLANIYEELSLAKNKKQKSVKQLIKTVTNYKKLIQCVGEKIKTPNKNDTASIYLLSNGKILIEAICSKCGKKKASFIKFNDLDSDIKKLINTIKNK